jgi:hypothetical protein
MDDFIKNAKGLSKNPLGIIALFISLIYGFACIVLGVSLNNLTASCERLPLIWFIIIFPVVILCAFIYLVVNHHEKLYAPSDFRDDSAFIKAMDKNDVKNKIDKEVESLTEVLKVESKEKANSKVEAETTKPTKSPQEDQITNKIKPTEPIHFRLKNAEIWAINEFSLQNNYSIKRNQRIVTHGGTTSFELDGMVNTNDSFLAIEVKYFADSPFNSNLKLKIQEYLRTVSKMRNTSITRLKFIPVFLVVFDSLNDTIKKDFTDFVKLIDSEVQLEFYDYIELQEKYKEK